MNAEELLKPRYEVIDRYPNMDEDNLIVGSIIEFTLFDTETNQWYNHNERSNTYDAFYDCFPNIFKKLNWWEKRKTMPKYVKSKHGDCLIVEKWEFPNGKKGQINTGFYARGYFWYVESVTPISEEEFLNNI